MLGSSKSTKPTLVIFAIKNSIPRLDIEMLFLYTLTIEHIQFSQLIEFHAKIQS